MARFGLKQFLFAAGFLLAAGTFSAAQAQSPFGALAIATDGAYGYSYNYKTIDEAQDLALAECNKHGKGCQILRVYENACIAVARNEDAKNVIVNWVSGYDRDERPRRALRNCRNDGGDKCKILVEFCTGSGR
jgi:hypothetical protein